MCFKGKWDAIHDASDLKDHFGTFSLDQLIQLVYVAKEACLLKIIKSNSRRIKSFFYYYYYFKDLFNCSANSLFIF